MIFIEAAISLRDSIIWWSDLMKKDVFELEEIVSLASDKEHFRTIQNLMDKFWPNKKLLT